MIDALVAFGPRVISYIPIAAAQVVAQPRIADMTVNMRAEGGLGFHESLLACVEDINAMLPGLSHRYEMPVIIDAMAEHVGSAVQVLLRKKLCDRRQADLIIKQLEGAAFMNDPEKAKSEEKTDAPTEGRSDPENSTPE
jgi:hypothetical protein